MTTLAVILSLLCAVAVNAADLTLAWDAPTNVAECCALTYRLYTGTSGVSRVYHSIMDCGTNLTATVPTRMGTTVYAVTACAGDLESEFSNELTITRVRPQKPTLTKYTITTKP